MAVGSTIELVDNILQNGVQNGMAIIRPPGHHAMKAEYNGYCFFNNVAIAAQHAIDVHDVCKLIDSHRLLSEFGVESNIYWFACVCCRFNVF